MEKIFDDYKGVILFYIIVALLALISIYRINLVNEVSACEKETETKVINHA